MKHRAFYITFLLLHVLLYSAFGNNQKKDSLLNELKNAKHDTTKINLLIDIGVLYYNIYPDSSYLFFQNSLDIIDNIKSNKDLKDNIEDKEANTLYYMGVGYAYSRNYPKAIESINKSLKKYEHLQKKSRISDCYNALGNMHQHISKLPEATEYYNKAIVIREELGDKSRIASTYGNLGVVYKIQGQYSDAIEIYKKAIEINTQLERKSTLAKDYSNLGIVYRILGMYPEALELQKKSLAINEELNDLRSISLNFINIGAIYQNMKSYSESIEYFKKSIEIDKKRGDKRGISISYSNIANSYREQGLYDLAIEHMEESIKLKKEIGDRHYLATTYNGLGKLYQEKKEYSKANEIFLKALKIHEELGNKNGIIHALHNLSSIQIVYGKNSSDAQAKKAHYQKAIKLSKEALEIAKSTKSIRQENPQYHHLHEAYSGLGDFEKAYEYAKLFIQTNDSLFSEEKTNAIAEMQTKYETAKKEQEIEKQKLIIAQQETDNQKQRIIHYFLGISASLLFLLILFVLYAYRQKRISHDSIMKKNNLLEQANEEIKAQKDEITSQRDMVFSQKKQIEDQNQKITDSINYAKVIQGAVLPSPENVINILEDYFILYKPKEIVSGDFYWVSKIKNLRVFAVADCTGHGVPGAFMSMLGLSFLNEIINKKGVTRPSEILNLIRESVIEALQQKGRFADQSEGINMSLCVWDSTNSLIHFSGAKNSLIIVTKDKKLTTIPADKQPIATHKKIKPFTEHKLEFNKGDIIYLATDGFQDQFGGDEYKRFTRRRFTQLLLEVSDKPLEKQKKIINNTFENWKYKNDQVDDITILAVKA